MSSLSAVAPNANDIVSIHWFNPKVNKGIFHDDVNREIGSNNSFMMCIRFKTNDLAKIYFETHFQILKESIAWGMDADQFVDIILPESDSDQASLLEELKDLFKRDLSGLIQQNI